MKKNKAAIILTVVSVLLWAAFLSIRISLPIGTYLSYQIDGRLFLLSALFTSVCAAFWLAALSHKWSIAGKIIVWCLYGLMSLFWLIVVAAIGSYFGFLFVNRYACDNDNNYVMRKYDKFEFDCYTVSLYQKQGLVDSRVCFLDGYDTFDDPKLFVYENSDAIVVQHRENDSVYTDVYHFNGDIYESPAKDSILDVVKAGK